jgi:hypothetical protein
MRLAGSQDWAAGAEPAGSTPDQRLHESLRTRTSRLSLRNGPEGIQVKRSCVAAAFLVWLSTATRCAGSDEDTSVVPEPPAVVLAILVIGALVCSRKSQFGGRSADLPFH